MQQTKDFKDFTIERSQYKVTVFKAKEIPTMDLYFRDVRTTTIVFKEGGIDILQNDKELTFTMDSILSRSLDFLKENFPKYKDLDNLTVRKAIRENYDQSGL